MPHTNLNAKDKTFGTTAFHLACESGNSNIVDMLVQKSAEFNINLNEKDVFGHSGFHNACNGGHLKVAKMLMLSSAEYNIDLNSKEKND